MSWKHEHMCNLASHPTITVVRMASDGKGEKAYVDPLVLTSTGKRSVSEEDLLRI